MRYGKNQNTNLIAPYVKMNTQETVQEFVVEMLSKFLIVV